MAQEIVKAWNMYIDGVKVATAQSFDYSNDAPGEIQITAEGVVGRAQGIPTSKVTMNTITTFGGSSVTQKVRRALLNNTPMKITGGVIDGKLEELRMWCISCKFNSDFQSGKATGSFEFEGGAPTFTG
jgi:hypothetical protein